MARPRSDIADRIQRAARVHFLEHGVDGASLRAIASASGTSIGMVYYYFPTKDDLFVAVVESVYARLLKELAAQLEQEGTIAAKVARLYARIWTLSEDEYAIVRLVMREGMVSAARVRRLSPLFAQGHVALLLSTLNEAVARGELRAEVPPIALLVVTIALGVMPMLVWRVAGQRLFPDFPLPAAEDLGGLFSTILLRGIGFESSSPRVRVEAKGSRRGRGRNLKSSAAPSKISSKKASNKASNKASKRKPRPASRTR